MFKTPILMLKMTFFWLLFRGKFEQKTQKSISFKNQWRLKNIKKAMVVKNIIAEDMPFTKSIFEQFWRSYCKKTIFVVFHFLKFLPKYKYGSVSEEFWVSSLYPQLWQRQLTDVSCVRSVCKRMIFICGICQFVVFNPQRCDYDFAIWL